MALPLEVLKVLPLEVLKVPSWEEGVLQTRQPLGLEVESLHRDNPSLDLSTWSLNKQTNKHSCYQRSVLLSKQILYKTEKLFSPSLQTKRSFEILKEEINTSFKEKQ